MARVLLIDDETLVLATLSAALRDAGHEVVEARDGRRGLAALAEQPVDLVVTDILMPERDGIEVILEIRMRWPRLKIIAISGGDPNDGYDYLPISKRLGADRTMTKPFLPAELVAAVDELLSGA
ncbi:MAG: response regulator [Alphaproteobacteria bacterium]